VDSYGYKFSELRFSFSSKLYEQSMTSLINLSFFYFRHLARNPFHCDCRLTWMVDWMENFPVETSGARCESPKRMHKKKLGSLRKEQLKCFGEILTPKKTFS